MTNKVHDLHHLLPRSAGGTNAKDNLVRVPQVLHRSWHMLFRNWLPPQIASEMNNTWISKRWKMVAFEKKPGTKGKRRKSKVLYEDKDCKVILKEK